MIFSQLQFELTFPPNVLDSVYPVVVICIWILFPSETVNTLSQSSNIKKTQLPLKYFKGLLWESKPFDIGLFYISFNLNIFMFMLISWHFILNFDQHRHLYYLLSGFLFSYIVSGVQNITSPRIYKVIFWHNNTEVVLFVVQQLKIRGLIKASKCLRKPKEQLWMENPEISATLDTKHRRRTNKQKQITQRKKN